MNTPERNKKWRKSWLEYIKNTNDGLENYDSSLRRSLAKVEAMDLKEEDEDFIDKVNRVRSGGSIKAYMRPQIQAPIDQAKEHRKEGMAKFIVPMLAIDVETGKARSMPNAKSIGALRNFLKINDISDKELNAQLKVTVPKVNFVEPIEW